MIVIRWLVLARFSYLDLVWIIGSWHMFVVHHMYWQAVLAMVGGALAVSAIEVGIGVIRGRS